MYASCLGDFMKDKYDGATEVRVNKRGRLQVKNAQYNLPTANDLVYLDESPDYCLRNKTIGSFGIPFFFCTACLFYLFQLSIPMSIYNRAVALVSVCCRFVANVSLFHEILQRTGPFIHLCCNHFISLSVSCYSNYLLL